MNDWVRRLIPLCIAIGYLLFVMRGAEQGPASPDGGQHAMNGALIHDYLLSGAKSSPMSFATEYLVHYPAISIGYHPPVFHAVESVFYAVFGVDPWSARLSVAAFAALSLLLLYRLVQKTHGSVWFASLVAIVFASLQLSQQSASDVMLEFPSLFFVLLALNCLLSFGDGFSWRSAILYATISGVAIWTKQHSVFLGLIPFFLVATSGKWSELRRLPIWVGAMLFGAACLLLVVFMSSILGDDIQPTSQIAVMDASNFIVWRNLKYYAWRLPIWYGWPTLVLTIVAFIAYWVMRIRSKESVQRLALYAAWTLAVLPIPAVAQQYDVRYLFAGVPAALVILFDMINRLSERLAGESRAGWVTAIVAVVVFGLPLRDHVTYNSGPAQAAEYIWEQQPQRVLVCGRGEHQFVFYIRCHAGPSPSLIILRGSKVPPDALQSEEFDQFGHEYGLDFVVIGDDWKAYKRGEIEDRSTYPWDPILTQPSSEMKLEQKIDMTNTYGFMEGDMLVYRFLNPSPNPNTEFKLWMGMMRKNVGVQLDGESESGEQEP